MKRIIYWILLFMMITSCNGGDTANDGTAIVNNGTFDEISTETPAIINYLKVKYEPKCVDFDGEVFNSILYAKGDSKCEGKKRVAQCINGELVISGDEKCTELSCEKEEEASNQVCISGKVLTIGIDRDDDGQVDEHVGNLIAYKGQLSASKNYNYYSASAHPKNGIEPEGFAHHLYFYEGSDGLSLQYYYNIDAGGSPNNKTEVELEIFNNSLRDKVILSDDKAELIQSVSTANYSKYKGKYHYWNNTDGGVIGPLGGEEFKVVIRPKLYGDIKESKFYSADGNILNLMSDDNSYSYIIEYKDQKDCTGEVKSCDQLTKNHIVNGSFENQPVLSQSQIEAGGASWDVLKSIEGWESLASSKAGIEVQVSHTAFAGLKAHSGSAKVELDAHNLSGFTKSHTHMYQDIEVDESGFYTLSFFYAARESRDTNRFKFRIHDVTEQKIIDDISFNNRMRSWSESRTEYFLAKDKHYRIEFIGVGEENTLGAFIDTVSLKLSLYYELSEQEKLACENPEDPQDPIDPEDPVDPITLDPPVISSPVQDEAIITSRNIIVEGACYTGAKVYIEGSLSSSKSQTCSSGRYSVSAQLSAGDGTKIVKAYQQYQNSISLYSEVNVLLDLSVPVVTIEVANDINILNENHYELSGTCSENGQIVDISMGESSFQTTCSDLKWSLNNKDISSLADGTVIIKAKHLDHYERLAQTTKTVIKNTQRINPIASFEVIGGQLPSLDLSAFKSSYAGGASGIAHYSWEISEEDVASNILVTQSGSASQQPTQDAYFSGGNFRDPKVTLSEDCFKYKVCLSVTDNLGLVSTPYCQVFESKQTQMNLVINGGGDFSMSWKTYRDKNVKVNWGDGSEDEGSGSLTHFYLEPINHNVSVSFCGSLVEELDLRRTSDREPAIVGSLPDFSSMDKVKKIAISGNQISGNLPTESLSKSVDLENFDASYNQLTGSIPANFLSENIKLKIINMTNNHLSGSLDNNLFKNNQNLLEIKLSYNNLNGSLPGDIFSHNQELEHIGIDNNKLSSNLAGDTFKHNKKLRQITLTNNLFSGTIPYQLFESNTELIGINLGGNQLSGELDSRLLLNNEKLVNLTFHENQLSGELPSDLFVNNSKLKTIILTTNQFSGQVPASFFHPTPIVSYINLSKNLFSGDLPSDLLSGLDQLISFNISNNQISGGLSSDLFSDNVSLDIIDLSYNQLSHFENNQVFKNNKGLRRLFLQHNLLSNGISISANIALNHFDGSYNEFKRSNIDNFIVELASTNMNGGILTVDHQNPLTPPSEQVQPFVDMLVNRNWIITTD